MIPSEHASLIDKKRIELARKHHTCVVFDSIKTISKPIDTIRMATVNAANLLRLDGKAGIVRQGSFADIVAADSDARAKVEQLGHVRFVSKDRSVFKNEWASLSVTGCPSSDE